MRAGKLDRTIIVSRFDAGAVNAYGTPEPTYAPIATVRAQVVQSSTEEFLSGQGATAETAIIFRIRYIPGLTTADRVGHEGRSFNLIEIKEIGRRHGLELRCEASE